MEIYGFINQQSKKNKERFAAITIQDFWYRYNYLSPGKFKTRLESANLPQEKEKVIKDYRNIVLKVFYRKMEDKYPNFDELNICDKYTIFR